MQETKKEAPAKAEVQIVKMNDGRNVGFAGKRKMVKETFTEGNSGIVRFDFRNGEVRTFEIPGDMLLNFALHGASQKIGDETAGLEDVDDMVVAVDEIINRLGNGEWFAKRSSGDGFAGASVVIRAICEVTGKAVSDVKAFLQKKLDDAAERGETLTRAALYASFRNPASKTGKVIERLEAEKRSKKGGPDANDLLSELV